MIQTITAIYKGGILRPEKPLPLIDDETVEITIKRAAHPSRPALAEEGRIRRIRDATSLDELWAAVDAAPEDDLPEGYDFGESLNENRRQSDEQEKLLKGHCSKSLGQQV